MPSSKTRRTASSRSTNDEMGWEAVVCEIVGPGADAWRVAGAERIGTSLKSRATTALPVARVADTDGWAAAVVVFEDRTVSRPRVWPLESTADTRALAS